MKPRKNLFLPSLITLGALSLPLQAQLLVTEIQSDGLWDFWELTNTGTEAVDLGGYKWDDDSKNPADKDAVTIPSGTTIAAGESIVFAGAGVGTAETFRNQWGISTNVQVIVGGPNFGGGDGVAFFSPSNTELFFFSYAAGGFTRIDGSPSSGGHAGLSAGGLATQAMVWDSTSGTASPRYTFATGSNFGTFAAQSNAAVKGSPGYSGFGATAPSVTLSLNATLSTFPENAANPASVGTVTRTGDTTNALVVNLTSRDTTEATVPASVTIPAGSSSVNFDITAVNDTFPDGTKTATITAAAVEATSGTIALTVTDDGDVADTDFLLTELQSNQSTGSPANSNDYWELTNTGSATRDISGYSWHDSGRSGASAAVYKLPSGTTIAPGESVIFTTMPAADFRTWWNIPNTVQVFQSTGAPGLGKGDGISFFDAQQNELFFFSYAAGGFTREDGNPSINDHAGIAAGGTDASQALVWVPGSGKAAPRYAAATGSNHGTFKAAVGTDSGSPGNTLPGAPTVSIASSSAAEGNTGDSNLVLNVTRTDISTAFTVNYAVTGGTAESGTDYTLVSGTLTFAANGPATLPINILVHGDTTMEENETVVVTLSGVVNTTGATVLGTAEGTGTIMNDETAAGTLNLANYVRTGRYNLPEPTRTALPPGTATHNLLCQEASGVTYNWDTDTLFITGDGGRSVTQVSKTGTLINTMSLDLKSGAPQGTEFYDPEGITYIGNGEFVLSEERDRQLVKFTYAAGTTLTRANAKTVDLGTFDDNTGTEGLSWDPLTGGFIVLKEKSPIGVFQTTIDFNAGTASNGSPTTTNSTNLFDTTLLGMSDVADVFTFSNLPEMAGTPQEANMLILGQENARILNVSRSGVVSSSLNITADPGDIASSPNMQHEGITMDRAGNIYIVNENGGGDINFPQLWVYSPTNAQNTAPTAVAVNNAVTTIQENSSTASPVKLGDIGVSDDGLGANVLSLAGADAAAFEISGNALYLKAGVTLDFETKASYSITINVDDTSVGSTPDASVNFTLTVTDQVTETPVTAALAITEVSAWASGNSPVGSDWFELTNISGNTVDITGWKVDDSSNSAGSGGVLSGVTTIAPNESVIFLLEVGAGEFAAKSESFIETWFDGTAPAGFKIGYANASGLGLSTGGDAVNVFNASGVRQAGVTFGASDSTSPYQSFDNTVAINNGAISLLNQVGVHGAVLAPNSAEIGSPGYSAPGVLRITEVAPWSSGNSPIRADWFEVTNVGARAVNMTGWKVDDVSESIAGAAPLVGVPSIAPGESAIYIETANLETARTAFLSNWFGANPPAGLQVGNYSGDGLGLGTGGDAVNLFDSNGTRRAKVTFGIAPSAAPFGTFDNTAAADAGAVAHRSVPGINGAFIAASSAAEVGSPGSAAAGGNQGFSSWLAAKGLSSFGFGADTDGDGVSDGAEFFFNENPNSGTPSGNLPSLVSSNGALQLDFTHLTNTGAVNGELMVSGDLKTWTPALTGLDYTVASSIATGDETAVTYALPGTGPSAPGTAGVHLSPNTSDPVGASLGGVRIVNEGLVGVGRLTGNSEDKFGETQGASSGVVISDWAWNGSQFSGKLNVLPDRGYGDGISNYAARLHEVGFTFTPYYGAGPVSQNQVSMTYLDSTRFTYLDGGVEKFTSGLNPTGNSTLFGGQTVGTVTAANGEGGPLLNLLSFDAEAIYLFGDGSGFVSDEYGTYIARFNAAKQIVGITQLPEAARPYRPANTPNFDSVNPPTTGRRNNQGLEGMSVTPDGTRLFALLQSATVQDTDGTKQQTRNNARLFVYDIAGEKREAPVLIGEYVVKLPQIDLDPNAAPSALNGTAAQSEIVALGNSSFLMLPRDGNGLGKLNSTAITFKSVQLVDFASASNILGQYDGPTDQITITPGVLRPEIKAAATAEVINMLQQDDLGKFGLNTTIPANANTLNEKIEGMALVPDLSTEQQNDFFLFVGNDNDFQSPNVRMLDASGKFMTGPNNTPIDGRASKDINNVGITNDAMFYVWRLTIDAGGSKFFRFEVK
ncbi:lamin tail domain-containing protein [Luteolibacter yonseiensis]|uniref:Lamin tail domain-containing protein n=1 Tax=Luteolibacter yonseiensis TaxID=1144680 RepID=A0A934R4W8_9BACT|nr:lamin tail domain-containing protein [Luteolibacter yonseiensis]MBK1815320.1 lamin tail domain-containing protein [Luteolibacter yonseiensis]